MTKIAIIGIWGPILQAFLTNGGSANQPQMANFEKICALNPN